MSQRHSTDEELIAQLDGELGLLSASSVQQHLKACWQCRGRMRELEDQALRVAKAVSADPFPGSDRVGFAIRRFSDWRTQAQRGEMLRNGAPVPARAWHGLSSGLLRWTVAGALCLAGAWIVAVRPHRPARFTGHMQSQAPAPGISPPQTVTLAAERVEQAWIDRPCHETLRIEMTAAASNRPVRSRLDLWSDRPSRRFAVEWRDNGGHLRAARWNPEPRRDYFFDPKTGSTTIGFPPSDPGHSPLIPFSGIQLTGSDRDLLQLEAQLIRYVRSRQLQPVSLSGTFAEFAGGNGLSLRREKGPSGNFEIEASRESQGVTAELILEVDAGTLQANSLRLRMHDARHSLQAVFVVEKLEALRQGQLKLATFEPKLDRGPALTPAPASTGRPEPIASDLDFSEKEIDIQYALHRIRACMGDPIRVEHLPSGRIAVRGLVDSSAQKEKILSVLRDFGGVEANIATVADAVRERPAVIGSLLPSEPLTLQIDNVSFPMHQKLQQYFSTLTDAQERTREIARFSNQAISLSGSALAEAWAIHRLRQTFRVDRPDPLGLIGQMAADHATAFRALTGELRALMQPFLPPSSAVSSNSPATLAAAQSMDDAIRSMFSSSQSAASVDADLQRLSTVLSTTDSIDFNEREP